MPSYMITLKEDAPESKLKEAKQQSIDAGGKIKDEFTLIKGFTVEFPEDKVAPLSTNEHVNVEVDSEMKIQN